MGERLKSILVIDDFALNLMIIKNALSEHVNVYIAKSGAIALKTLALVDIDLFLLDLQMPEMSGFDFLEKLRRIEKYKSTPVIIVSSKDREDVVMRALACGAADYIVKPFDQAVLCEKVLSMLNI